MQDACTGSALDASAHAAICQYPANHHVALRHITATQFHLVTIMCTALRFSPGMSQTAWTALVRQSGDAASHCLHFGIYTATSLFTTRSYQEV